MQEAHLCNDQVGSLERPPVHAVGMVCTSHTDGLVLYDNHISGVFESTALRMSRIPYVMRQPLAKKNKKYLASWSTALKASLL